MNRLTMKQMSWSLSHFILIALPLMCCSTITAGDRAAAVVSQVPVANSRETITIIGAHSTFPSFEKEASRVDFSRPLTIDGGTDQATELQLNVELAEPMMVGLEKSADLKQWISTGMPIFAPYGEAQFFAPISSEDAYYRIVSAPLPIVPVLTREGYKFDITGPLSVDVLADYLKLNWGVVPPPLTREQSIKVVAPPRGGAQYSLNQLSRLSGVMFPVPEESNLTPDEAPLQFRGRVALPLETPQLHIVEGFSLLSATQKDITQSLKITVQWTPGNRFAKSCQWVLQRGPFQVNNPQAPPAHQSVVGSVTVSDLSENNPVVWFDVNLVSQAKFGLELPMKFYLRVTEKDGTGNTLGIPSNIVTIDLKPDPAILPPGVLRMRMGNLHCHDTTSGLGNDDPGWDILHLAFGDDAIQCKFVNQGTGGSLGDNDSVAIKAALVDFQGPGQTPKLNGHYLLYALREHDNPDPLGGVAFSSPLDAEQYAILANGLQAVGKSRQFILDELKAKLRSSITETADDVIGLSWVQFNKEDLDKAFLNGFKTRVSTMSGDGSLYSTTFDLLWYPE